MTISTWKDMNNGVDVYSMSISVDEQLNLGNMVKLRVVEKLADAIADDYIEKHFAEIMGKISPEAIANMAIAEAGAKINETLNKKMPDKIIEIEKRTTEVYQRGLFGGLKRI